jgi:DNA repair protein RadD
MNAQFQNRDYQEAAINTGVNFFTKPTGKNGIEVIPTGGGKSIVIGGIASNISGNTLVLQPSKEILEQNFKKAQRFMGGFKFGDNDLGVYSASFGMKQVRKVTFATIGSIVKKPEIFEHFDNIVQDECDTTNAKGGMYAEFFEHLGKPVLGLTATPYRLHPPTTYNNSVIKFIHRTRPRVFSELLHVTQNKELFDRGYLCAIRYHREEFDAAQLTLNTTGADFTELSVKEFWRENDLTGKITRYVKESTAPHVLTFVDYFDEAIKLQKRLLSAGYEAVILTGKTPDKDREKILGDFTSGRQRIVINMGVLTVGFDFPALSYIINARPTNSLRLYYQILGRGIRTFETKDFCDYIDLGGNITRFGRIEDFEITGEKGKERLKSGDRFLTGVDLKTGKDLEAAREQENAASDVIWFGKHKGEKISQLPATYLSWIIENFSPGALKNKAQEEMQRRQTGGMRQGGING